MSESTGIGKYAKRVMRLYNKDPQKFMQIVTDICVEQIIQLNEQIESNPKLKAEIEKLLSEQKET